LTQAQKRKNILNKGGKKFSSKNSNRKNCFEDKITEKRKEKINESCYRTRKSKHNLKSKQTKE
jgi:hypothetical protein